MFETGSRICSIEVLGKNRPNKRKQHHMCWQMISTWTLPYKNGRKLECPSQRHLGFHMILQGFKQGHPKPRLNIHRLAECFPDIGKGFS